MKWTRICAGHYELVVNNRLVTIRARRGRNRLRGAVQSKWEIHCDGDLERASTLNVRILVVDRARVHDDVRALDVLGGMTDVDTDAHRLEAARDVVRLEIGARDVELHGAEDLGEAAHADPADPDEVSMTDAAAEHQDTTFDVGRCMDE